MTEGEERGGRTDGSDDLFENLDSFFEPIDDIGWPEEGLPVPSAPTPIPTEAESAEDAPVDEQSFEQASAASDTTEDAREAQVFEGEGELDAATADTEFETFSEREDDASDADDPAEAVPDMPAGDATLIVEVDEEEIGDLGVEEAAEHFASSGYVSELEGADIEQEILADLDAPAIDETIIVAATEGLQGPSWQEPMHEEVEVDPGPAASRNVPAAFVTGIAMAVVMLVALAVDKGLFAVVAGAVVLAAQAEFYAALRRRHYQPATLLGLIFGGLILAAGYLKGEAAMVSMLALAVIFTFFWEMATPAKFRKHIVANIGITLLGLAYIPLLAGFGFTILAIEPSGRALILAVLGLTFVYDTVAFVVGSWWGETQLAPHISPKKSWQGAIAASFAVVILSVLFVSNIDGMGLAGAAGMAIVVFVLAPFGDLSESLLKRDLGIKDMGSILPGHGGILDRIDSVLFVAPVALMLLGVIFSG